MRWILSIITIALIFVFYKNYLLLSVLIYGFLMLCPLTDKFLKNSFKINLWDYAYAFLLILYGIFWIIKRKLRRVCGDMVIIFFISLQLFLKLFHQIDFKKNY